MTTNNSSTTGAQLDEKQIFDLAEAEDAKLRAKADELDQVAAKYKIK